MNVLIQFYKINDCCTDEILFIHHSYRILRMLAGHVQPFLSDFRTHPVFLVLAFICTVITTFLFIFYYIHLKMLFKCSFFHGMLVFLPWFWYIKSPRQKLWKIWMIFPRQNVKCLYYKNKHTCPPFFFILLLF